MTTLVSYGVGTDDDTMPGIAHATEHMLFRGTQTVSGGQLADIAARMGAQYNRQPLSVVELQRAKALLLAQRVLPLDSYAGLAADMVSGALYGSTTGSEQWFWAALLQTTPAQLQHALRRIDADHFLRVIVEPGG